MAEAQRIEIGFEGGQIVTARLREEALRELRSRLDGGGWYDLQTEDGTLTVYLGKVAFVQIESSAHQVGFALGG